MGSESNVSKIVGTNIISIINYTSYVSGKQAYGPSAGKQSP